MPALPNATLVWFREDLRIQDNPCLHHALNSGRPLLALFILEDDQPRPYGKACRWWLHHSLQSLECSLTRYNIKLHYFKGNSLSIIEHLTSAYNIEEVIWNRGYTPHRISTDQSIKKALQTKNINVSSFNGSLLIEPWKHLNRENKPFKVFTPFYKAAQNKVFCYKLHYEFTPSATAVCVPSESLTELGLLAHQEDLTFSSLWKPGEEAGQRHMECFFENQIFHYKALKDRPDLTHTSFLSPYLRWGEVSIMALYQRSLQWQAKHPHHQQDIDCFLKEIFWREFSYNLLYHFPQISERSLKAHFNHISWSQNDKNYELWKKGLTGYPLVDAGMRQLLQTGWMHNRVRMLCASFLVKHLLIEWQKGEQWFWSRLVDADPANNAVNWQWAAGSGVDCMPFFRIFNPVRQGEIFDPHGHYVRRFVPELQHLPEEWIHTPWRAPQSILKKSAVSLGETYPNPMVDHAYARKKALEALNISLQP